MPYEYNISDIRVIDGDTVEATIHLGFNIDMRRKIRLLDLDTWEVRGPNKELGLKAKEYLKSLLENKEVILLSERDKKGKYGRILGTLLTDTEDYLLNINCLMREHWSKEK